VKRAYVAWLREGVDGTAEDPERVCLFGELLEADPGGSPLPVLLCLDACGSPLAGGRY
jgi:hypothetical protein